MVEQSIELSHLKNADRSLFPGSFTIRALRDSRYHNAAYAIAELIDNSIEANAPQIEVLCMESTQVVGSQSRNRVSGIAVLDDGDGMDTRTLLEALKFGGGTRHGSIRGIGKYGMGLPTASLSQCKKVDVWTWQDGPSSVWHSCIDAEEIEKGNHLVPFPDQETPIPQEWMVAGNSQIFNNATGTLVVWNNLDKIQWKTANAIIQNTYREVGRIHRHYIDATIHTITAKSFRDRQPGLFTSETPFVTNDPLYLMAPTSVPESPWDDEPMFEQWGPIVRYPHISEGKEEVIEVKYSIVKPDALKTELVAQNPGDAPRGKHARHNIGVSVVREDREIVLEDSFLREGGSAENPQNRWWGCEVSFRRGSDEVFGLDHNKQMVANFTQAAKTLARDDRPNPVILDELGLDDDVIHEIVGDIRDQTRAMMSKIRQMFAQKRKPTKTDDEKPTPESTATETATKADHEAIKAGREEPTNTDKEREEKTPADRISGLTSQFEELGQSREEAESLAKSIVEKGLGYRFNSTQLDAYMIFNVRSDQGVLHINLNTDHAMYDLLRHIEGGLDEDVDENDPAFQATVAIRLLISSWARMEDQMTSREDRANIQYIATLWGRQAEKMLSQLREREEWG